MNFNNIFAKAMKKQLDQGCRVEFSMLIKARNLDLPIDMQTKLFESIVCPILLYSSEVWEVKKIDMLGIFYRKLFKQNSKIDTLHTKLYYLRGGGKITTTNIR